MLDRHRFLSLNDLTHMPKPVWAIEGLFELNSLVMLAGPPASYKSFMALDWILSMASGRNWNSRPTVPAKVLYVLGEGKSSLLKRVNAWSLHYEPTAEQLERLNENFRVTFDVPQMAIKASVDNMLMALEAEQFRPTVICVDTFARSFVGLDENSQKDTGLWVESAERLRAEGFTVIFLHHTKKNTEFGIQYRGSTVLMGAMDTSMTMAKSKGMVTFTVTKQKDHDEGEPMHFQRKVLTDPGDPKDEGSMVLIPTILVDERFKQNGDTQVEVAIKSLIESADFPSDAARGRELAKQFGMSEAAGAKRVGRFRRENPILAEEMLTV